MIEYSCKIVTLLIVASILCTSAQRSIKDETCHSLRYEKSNVANKPDLVFVEKINLPENIFASYKAICRMNKDNSTSQGKFVATSEHFRTTSQLEYDSTSDTIYVQHKDIIETVNLSNGKVKSMKFELLRASALDWVSKNLYICSEGKVQLVNLNDDSKAPKTIVTYNRYQFYPSVKVFPNEGYIVVKTTPKSITLYNQDGSNPIVLCNYTDVEVGAIALDNEEKKIYWIETNETNFQVRIRYSNFKGEVKTIEPHKRDPHYRPLLETDHLQVDEKYVYFEEIDNVLFRADKFNGAIDEDFKIISNAAEPEFEGRFGGVSIISNPQVVADDHPCQHDNGGCKGFCVVVPDKTQKLTKKCLDTKISYLKKAWNKIKNIFG